MSPRGLAAPEYRPPRLAVRSNQRDGRSTYQGIDSIDLVWPLSHLGYSSFETQDGKTGMTTYELSNGDRILRFTGDRIAHASSRRGSDSDALRWTDIDIYRTASGQYVLHRVGKSRVYHGGPKACSGPGGKKTTPKAIFATWPTERYTDLEWCPVCEPPDLKRDSSDRVRVEVDRGQTFVSTTAEGVVESAYGVDPEGVKYLTKTAERALRDAATRDEAIKNAFLVETIA